MPDLGLQTFNKLYPMMIRKYQDLVVDQNASEKDKINSIIQKLNALGKLSNDVVRDWNTVYQWAMNDGLNQDVSNKLEQMRTNGEISSLLQNIYNSLVGDMTALHTTKKDTFVNVINEVDDLAKANATAITTIQGKQTTDETNITNNTNAIGTLTNLTTTHKDNLVNAINDNVVSLAQSTSDSQSRAINAMYPPAPLVACKGDGTTDDAPAIRAIINYIKTTNQGLILYFPAKKFNCLSKIGNISFPLRIWGSYANENGTNNNSQTGTIIYDNSPSAGDDGTPFIKYTVNDADTGVYSSFMDGLQIKDIYIHGNDQAHDGLYLKKIGWGTDIKNLCISHFGGAGLFEDEVYDANIIGLTITYCGGSTIGGTLRYSLHMDALLGDYTNAQHFFGTHIEHTRYALYINNVTGVYFDSLKFEMGTQPYTDDFTNPCIWVTNKAKCVDIKSVYLVSNSVASILSATTLQGKTATNVPFVFQKDDGSTSDWAGGTMTIGTIHTTTPDLKGAKWLNLKGASVSNLVLNCSTGFVYSSYFYDCIIGNLVLGVIGESDGSNYGVEIDSYTIVSNLKATSHLNAGQNDNPCVYLHGYYSKIKNYSISGFLTNIKTSNPSNTGVQVLRNALDTVVNNNSNIIDLSKSDSSVLFITPSSALTIDTILNGTAGERITMYNNSAQTVTIANTGNILWSGTIASGTCKQFVITSYKVLPL